MIGVHVEITKYWNEHLEYCKKGGNFIEYGTPPKQGDRKDLDAIGQAIGEGVLRVDDILERDLMTYHMYGRALRDREDLYMRSIERTEMTQGLWLWGNTGVGKTHHAYNFCWDNEWSTYTKTLQDEWWDGYCQQTAVIMNEFRGQIPYGELLDLVDKWPKRVKRRGREPVPFTSKWVIITSSLPPGEIYHNLADNDRLEQLERRFHIVHLEQKYSEGNNVTSESDYGENNIPPIPQVRNRTLEKWIRYAVHGNRVKGAHTRINPENE